MADLPTNPADADELQFDQAEYTEGTEAAGPSCVACHQPIHHQYFQLNGAILCGHCREQIMAGLNSGSWFVRFLKASLFGFGAAIAGFAIYFGILKVTGYQIGLISILVGFLVGMAVRKGSENRGGALYQLTAVFFTYLAIAASYSALILPEAFQEMEAQQQAEAQAGPKAAAPVEVEKAAANPPEKVAEAPVSINAVNLIIGLVFLFGLALAIPVISGFSNPIGLLIVAFALWEAFKINRKTPLVITGPHLVGPGPNLAPAHV